MQISANKNNTFAHSQSQLNPVSSTITETLLPRYRRADLKPLPTTTPQPLLNSLSNKESMFQLEPIILSDFSNLSEIINKITLIFQTRMEVHEQELLKIVHAQVKKMQEQCQKTIKKYNTLIKAKNIQSEIWDLHCEVRYYQNKAVQINQENKQLRKQIKRMKQQIEEMELKYKCEHFALRNVSKKYLKEKVLRKNQILDELHEKKDEIKSKLIRFKTDELSNQMTPQNSKNCTSLIKQNSKKKQLFPLTESLKSELFRKVAPRKIENLSLGKQIYTQSTDVRQNYKSETNPEQPIIKIKN